MKTLTLEEKRIRNYCEKQIKDSSNEEDLSVFRYALCCVIKFIDSPTEIKDDEEFCEWVVSRYSCSDNLPIYNTGCRYEVIGYENDYIFCSNCGRKIKRVG